jgi:exodeoxyribonuclease X
MRLPFGKYKGEHVEDIANEDPGYLRWMEENANLDDELRDAINYALEAPTGRVTSVGRVVRRPQ